MALDSTVQVPTRTVAVHRVTAMLAGARHAGLDVDELCAAAGIPPALLEVANARVTTDQAARIVEIVSATLQDEAFGLCVQRMRPGTFAAACHATIHCSPDLRTALRRFGRFYRLFGDGLRIEVDEDVDHDIAAVTVELAANEGCYTVLAETVVVLAHRMSNWLVGTRIELAAIEFTFPQPPHVIEYDLAFGCPVRFGARRNALLLARADLDKPLIRSEEDLREFLRNAAAEVMVRRQYSETNSTRVRRVLAQTISADLADLDQVAAILAMSPQNLRRCLLQEGTSFREVRDSLRRDVAIESLARGTESIDELSARLGFSEPSAFHRAFRRWTGSTPRTYQPAG